MGVSELMAVPAIWGFLGAVVFAGPKLTACIYNATEIKARYGRCVAEAVVAVLTGAIGAAAFAPWLGARVHMTSPPDARALATVIGILANPTAPGIISLLSDNILTRIKGGH